MCIDLISYIVRVELSLFLDISVYTKRKVFLSVKTNFLLILGRVDKYSLENKKIRS